MQVSITIFLVKMRGGGGGGRLLEQRHLLKLIWYAMNFQSIRINMVCYELSKMSKFTVAKVIENFCKTLIRTTEHF